MNEILIELHARDLANNRYRAWRVVVGRSPHATAIPAGGVMKEPVLSRAHWREF
jgi:hypothetical protein